MRTKGASKVGPFLIVIQAQIYDHSTDDCEMCSYHYFGKVLLNSPSLSLVRSISFSPYVPATLLNYVENATLATAS